MIENTTLSIKAINSQKANSRQHYQGSEVGFLFINNYKYMKIKEIREPNILEVFAGVIVLIAIIYLLTWEVIL